MARHEPRHRKVYVRAELKADETALLVTARELTASTPQTAVHRRPSVLALVCAQLSPNPLCRSYHVYVAIEDSYIASLAWKQPAVST